MRVTGGELRSRVIPSPSSSAIRPTPGRVKEALFSMLGQSFVGMRVLDLYAGSGAIGFEALSRGADHVVFVEFHAPTARAIGAAARELGLAERATIVCAAAEKAVTRLGGRFDLVYADPPYAAPPPQLAFSTLLARGHVDVASTLVYEHRDGAPDFIAPGFLTARAERYGEVRLQFLRVDASRDA